MCGWVSDRVRKGGLWVGMGSATIINIVGYGYGIMGSYRFIYIYIYIYIYYLIKYCRAGGYPSDQNFKNRYPSVIQIFKISVSVSVRIYASEQAGGRAGFFLACKWTLKIQSISLFWTFLDHFKTKSTTIYNWTY